MSKNFTCDASSVGIPISVTSVSAATAIDNSATTIPCIDVLVDNRGAADVFIVTGGSGVVATTANLRVPANSMFIYRKNTATHIALITASGTSTVYVHKGEGF